MAHPADVARGRNIVARWCNLAEQRLDYLTELFETGRWRRFHSEREFLENIQEAKAAVATWRDLLNREASLDNTTIDLAWLGRRGTLRLPLTPLPRDEGYRRPIVSLQPQAAPIAAAPPPRDMPADFLVALENRIAVAEDALPAPDVVALDELPVPVLDLDAMKNRYPLLRNAL
ncbi:TIGR03809 family protein [Bradyrhizobium sp.]|jgi:uncharacterized repeat protein (TIGR03809 family)|uniref:TIGR03809 family protein n=1 Tax=Bradyrhizobium sp. TaxID=376 RepID=UPI002B6CA310|nr:TIGR03809 family protein [Bradyrhizobium sp.]HMM89830.1 TIGR03809 family protein [Bradyrhizobium sp.]